MSCFNVSFRVYLREEIGHRGTLSPNAHGASSDDEQSRFREVEVTGCFRLIACGGFSCAYVVDYGGYRLVFKVPATLRDYVERGIKPTSIRSLEAFSNELDVLKKLKHPNIVELLGYGVDFPVLVYEYGEHTLRDLMKGLREGDCLKYALEVAEALRFIHSRGIVHGDIKPENILVVNGVVKLTDFNMATKLLAAASSSRLAACTPGYCAPEQLYADLRKEAVEGGFENRIDVYQLGNVMLECLTGETIDGYDAVNEAKVREALGKVGDEDVRELLRQMLSYKPGERPSSEEVVKKLKAITGKKEGNKEAEVRTGKHRKETEIRSVNIAPIANFLERNITYLIMASILIPLITVLALIPSIDYTLANLFTNLGIYEAKIGGLILGWLHATSGINPFYYIHPHSAGGLLLLISLIMLLLIPLTDNDNYIKITVITVPLLLTLAALLIIPSGILMFEATIGSLLIGTATVHGLIDVEKLNIRKEVKKEKDDVELRVFISILVIILMILILYKVWWSILLAVIIIGVISAVASLNDDVGASIGVAIIAMIISAVIIIFIPKVYLITLIASAMLIALSINDDMLPTFLMITPLISIYFVPETLVIIDAILSEFAVLTSDIMKKKKLNKLLYICYVVIVFMPIVYVIITKLIL